MLDGSKAYLHAIIDNFSRRVLAWKVNDSFIPAATAELLMEAGREIEDAKPQVLVDGGVENYNSAVDKLVDSGLLKRILAQTEIRYSNSLIESWWRVIKHQWLFLNTLDTVANVRKLVTFYVEQHNRHLPHSAFKGQTPGRRKNAVHRCLAKHLVRQSEHYKR
ncbi:MAG: DDE-type integrase/transposase/recombinase [Fuerstiella sp.]|nr:DDE-type integrase/transposase/recombinase [Fuerstiella sp.]